MQISDNATKFYIDGQWVEPSGSERLDVINPATEESIGEIALGKADDVDAAVDAAVRVDRRFRAQGWLRRAEAHPQPNAQSVRLLERAVAADPEWPVAASALSRHRQDLNDSR